MKSKREGARIKMKSKNSRETSKISIISRSKGPFRAMVSVMVLWSFLFYTLSADIAGARISPSDLTRTGSGPDRAPKLLEEFDADTFELPEKLGRVNYRFSGDTERTVIHIQDAHCNKSIQNVIYELIGHLNTTYGVSTINLEGGAGEYDLAFFTEIKDKNSRRFVAEYFLDEGILNGAEFYAVNNEGKADLWGMENGELYIKNLEVYRASLGYKPTAVEYLDKVENTAEALKSYIYSDSLADLDGKHAEYAGGRLGMVGYLYYLRQKAGENGISLEGFPNLVALYETKEIEKKIDIEKANKERDAFIERLREVMSVNEIAELSSVLRGFRAGDVTREVFYAYLRVKARELNVPISVFPELFEYDAYVANFDVLDGAEAKEEMARLERAVREALYASEDEKKLDGVFGKISVMRDLIDLRLKEKVYRCFRDKKDTVGVSEQAAFLAQKAGEFGVNTGWTGRDVSQLDGYLKKASRFYKYSCERDNAFLKNIRFGDKGPKAAIVITGGFHTDRLMELLKDRGISCVSIVPAYREDNTGESPYYRILSGGLDPVSESLSILVSNMQIPSILSSMAPDVWGENNIYALRAARDILEMIARTGRPVSVICPDGNKIRFFLSAAGLAVEDKAVGKLEGEEVFTIDQLVSLYGKRPQTAAAPAEATPAPPVAEAPERAPAPIPEPVAPAAATGIKRLMGLLSAFIQTEQDSVPIISVVPDIHGNLDKFQDSNSKIPPNSDEIVYLGDYMDRGADGIKIIREIMKLKAERPGVVTLMGNHDLMFTMAMMGDEDEFDRWMEQGGASGLKELGHRIPDGLEEMVKGAHRAFGHGAYLYKTDKSNTKTYNAFRQAVLQDANLIEIAEWMKQNLDLYHIGRSGILYMHAGVPMDEFCNITLRYADEHGAAYEKLAALAKIEEDMKFALYRNDTKASVLQFLSNGRPAADGKQAESNDRTSPLWVRYADRSGQHSPDLFEIMQGREEKVMNQLGLSMLVVGHHPVLDPLYDIINLNSRIFYVDRDYREEKIVVMYNDAEGFKYALKTNIPEIIVSADSFEEQRQAARERAKEILADLREKYGDPAPTDLIGKVFDADGKLVTNVKVVRQADNKSIDILNAADGMPVYDKYGMRIAALPLQEITELNAEVLKDTALRDLAKFYKAGLFGKGGKAEGLAGQILDGAIAVIRESDIHLLGANDHGVIGVSDASGKKPALFLSAFLAANEDVFTVAVFHEAAEIFLARNKDLIPEGVDAHTLLRGASKEERRKDPGSFRKGLQDKIFGELNADLSYEVALARGEYIFESEAKLLNAILLVHGNNAEAAKSVLAGQKAILGLTQNMAKVYLRILAQYKEARAEYTRTQQANVLDEDKLQIAVRMVQQTTKDDKALNYTLFRSKNSAMKGINSPRVITLLEQLAKGEREDIPVIPTRENRERMKVMDTVKANIFSRYQRGAIVDLPEGVEIIIVGDLHTRLDNLKRILSENNNLEKIRKGEAILLILGDAVHPDISAVTWSDNAELLKKLAQMESSVRIIQFIQRLKRENPNSVYYTIGNHDYLTQKAAKSVKNFAVAQGLEFRKELEKQFGEEYVTAYESFISSSPLMAMTPDGLVTIHAAPIRCTQSLDDIRNVNVLDENNQIVHEALWLRFNDPAMPYRERDVDKFLKAVGGKMLVVAHTSENIKPGKFYAELLPGKHYVTMNSFVSGPFGYLSFRNGKLEIVDMTGKMAEEETVLLDRVAKEVAKKEKATPPLGSRTIEERLALLEKRFGKLKVIRWLGAGTFSDVYEVEDAEGNNFAIKVAGGMVEKEKKALHRSRMVLTVTDVPFGIIMAEDSKRADVDFIPEIIDAGEIDGEPYLAKKVVHGYQKITGELLAGLSREEVHLIADKIARIATFLETRGLIMFDSKPENFGYYPESGRVILLDTGACDYNCLRMSRANAEKIRELGISESGKSWSVDRILREVEGKLLDRLSGAEDKDVTGEVLKQVMDKARAEESVKLLYESARNTIRNIRERSKPVVVFLQSSGKEEGGEFGLTRKLERELRKKYDTDNLRVMHYDGTREGLDQAMGRAKSILSNPDARAVVYVTPELHPGKADGNVYYIKEECPEGDMLSLVGPHVAFALGIINYCDGNASDDLLTSLEDLVKMMVSDRETMAYINEKGMGDFLNRLLAGITLLKMKKVDFEKMRDAIEAQEQLLHSL
jgi:predicted MPP superfamily phosphohydrolase/chemotaxis regulatin CheY-phosphate phosphatase CheZ